MATEKKGALNCKGSRDRGDPKCTEPNEDELDHRYSAPITVTADDPDSLRMRVGPTTRGLSLSAEHLQIDVAVVGFRNVACLVSWSAISQYQELALKKWLTRCGSESPPDLSHHS